MNDCGTCIETADKITLYAHVPAKRLGEFKKLRNTVNKCKWREKQPHTCLCTRMFTIQRSWELGCWVKVRFEYLGTAWAAKNGKSLHPFREVDFNEWSFEKAPPGPYPTALIQQARMNASNGVPDGTT